MSESVWECFECGSKVTLNNQYDLDAALSHWKHCETPSDEMMAMRRRAGLVPGVVPISPSRLINYEMCPRREWFSSIEPGHQRTAGGAPAELGHAVHAFAETDDPRPSVELPMELVDDYEWMLRTLKRLDQRDPLPHIERAEFREMTLSITYPLSDGRVVEFEGRSDRLYVYDDGSILVDDFKSGRKVEEDISDLESNVQGRSYLVGAKRLFPYGTRFMFRQAQLRKNDIVESRWWKPETVDLFDQLLEEKCKRYAETTLWKTTPGAHCHFCDYVHRCTAGQEHLGHEPFRLTIVEAPQTLDTPENVAAAAMALDVTQAGVKRLSAALREATKRANVGPVRLDDGRWVGWKHKERQQIKDVEAALAAMQNAGVDNPWERLSFNHRKRDGFDTYLAPVVETTGYGDYGIHKPDKKEES